MAWKRRSELFTAGIKHAAHCRAEHMHDGNLETLKSQLKLKPAPESNDELPAGAGLVLAADLPQIRVVTCKANAST